MSISFDGPGKRVFLGIGVTRLSVRELWSRYCDWIATDDNSKYGEAMRQVGGDIVAIPIYIFLLNGWRIVPQAANHTLEIFDGILYVEGGGDPFVDPDGTFRIRISYQAPGIAIGYESGGGSGGGLTENQVRSAVWNAPISDYTAAGTFGYFVQKLLTLKKYLGLK